MQAIITLQALEQKILITKILQKPFEMENLY